MTYYIGYYINDVKDEFHVLAKSKSYDAALFITRAYNHYAITGKLSVSYYCVPKNELPKNWKEEE